MSNTKHKYYTKIVKIVCSSDTMIHIHVSISQAYAMLAKNLSVSGLVLKYVRLYTVTLN